MLGGSSRPELASSDDSEITRLVTLEMQAMLGLRGELVEVKIWRQPRAIPRYGQELLDVWSCARESWCARPGRVLFGNYAGQVSLRGMIGSVADALELKSLVNGPRENEEK
jgi:protoporphyrinogen oxidase